MEPESSSEGTYPDLDEGYQNQEFVFTKKIMDPKRLSYLTLRLSLFQLTGRERQFVELMTGYFREKGQLTEEQETILEGIYKEKLRLANLGPIKGKNTVEGISLTKKGG